jgi:hypothetical protein
MYLLLIPILALFLIIFIFWLLLFKAPRIIKNIFVSVLIFFTLWASSEFFIRKNYSIEKTIKINKPDQEVFEYLKLLRNHKNFAVGEALTNPKVEFKGTDGTVGFVAYLEDDVEISEHELKSLTRERIDYELRISNPFQVRIDRYFVIEKISDNETFVRWGFKTDISYYESWYLLFIDFEKTFGEDLQAGLENLKRILESHPVG